MSSPAEFPRFDLPIFLNTSDLRVLVVGGGPVGQRKMGVLLAAGAVVRLVCLEPQPAGLTHLRLEWRSEPYKSEHLDGARLIFTAATEDVNRRVQADAAARGLLICRADDAQMGDFITPAFVTSGRQFRLALSTGGASPTLSRRIRSRLWEMFDDTFGEWVDLLDDWRSRAGSGAWRTADGRRQFLEQISDWFWLDCFRAEGAAAVERAYAELATELGLSGSVV
jgi:precorrin-2 dehydrogenase/sirohydrochlorin ferrochelatase